MFYQAADSLDLDGIDAEAVSYGVLPLQWHPVGAGQWRLDEAASVPGDHLVLTTAASANPKPATPRIEFYIYGTRNAALDAFRQNKLDWVSLAWDEEENLSDLSDANVGTFAQPLSWTTLDFNIREGQLFSDVNLRKALSQCIDIGAAVAAAAGDQGAPAAGLFAPQFWAADPNLGIPQRDVEAARHLIEDSGWQLNGTTYEKGGHPLAADIWVREEFTQRVRMVDLVAAEAKDCGMDLTVKLGNFDSLLRSLPNDHPIYRWPNRPPDSDKPFDLYSGGLVGGHDPDPAQQLECYQADQISTRQNQYGCNINGYSNTQFDQLMAEASGLLDIPERASLYRQALDILHNDLPTLPLYYLMNRIVLREGLKSVEGPLDLNRPGWWWQLESLELETAPQ